MGTLLGPNCPLIEFKKLFLPGPKWLSEAKHFKKKHGENTHRIHRTETFAYIYHRFMPNVGEYTIHGSYGIQTKREKYFP